MKNGTSGALTPTTTQSTTVGASGLTTNYVYSPNTSWLPNITNWAIGFDRQWDLLETLRTTMPTNSNYPPYNIIKINDDEYLVEMALAGFKRKEITIVQQEQTLTISGEKFQEDQSSYVHKGIGARSFKQTFALSDYVEVENASFDDGILSISLRRELPEEKKARVINIK